MKKKTIMYSLAVSVLVAAAVLTVGSIVQPPEAEAIGGCRCLGPVRTTGVLQSDKSTCAAATAALHVALENQTSCGGQFCVNELIITMPCTYNPAGTGSWWVSGKLRYQCEFCPYF